MATTFTKAMLFNSNVANANFGKPSVLNDGSFTYVMGLFLPAGFNGQNLISKTDDDANNNGYYVRPNELSGNAYADSKVARATSASFYRANPAFALDGWRWIAITLDRTTPTFKFFGGSYGGALSDMGAGDILGGSGAVSSDAAYNLRIGLNDTAAQLSTYPVSVFFFGRWNSALSLATINGMVADMDANGLPTAALYVKPEEGDTAAIDLANGNDGVWGGAVSIVDGPDPAASGPTANAVQYYRRLAGFTD